MIEPGKYFTSCGLPAVVLRIRAKSKTAWVFNGAIYAPTLDIWFLHQWNISGESYSTDKDYDLKEKHAELDQKRID